jgi:tRNA(Ile)-lysidine synthase
MRSPLTSDVQSFLQRHGIKHQTILLAVSGGIDSITMLHVMAELRTAFNLVLHVVHVDHGLRPDSINDATFVKRIAESLQINCHSSRVDVFGYAEEHGGGIEHAARELRYRVLHETALIVGASVVMTGHTADDNVETVLMHVARAGTIQALAGIPVVRQLSDSVSVYRPFRDLPRVAIHEHAKRAGISWIEDPTNAEPIFLRNRVRNEVIPVLQSVFGPQVNANIRSMAAMMADMSSLIGELLSSADSNTFELDGEHIRIDDALLNRLPQVVMTEILRTRGWCTHADVDRIVELRHSDVGVKASLSRRRIAVRERSAIVIISAEPSFDANTACQINPVVPSEYVSPFGRLRTELCERETLTDPTEVDGAKQVVFDQAALVGKLSWRVWQSGDRLHPLGMHGTKLVSDLLTEAKIDHTKRKQARVLADEEGILWVCGVRRSDRALVTDHTSRILRCQFLSE